MSLHTDWSDAKKDSKAKFKAALTAQRAALEKKVKGGDAKHAPRCSTRIWRTWAWARATT
jgi:hypothetical protein